MIVPQSKTQDILHYSREIPSAGHLGVDKTLEKLKIGFYILKSCGSHPKSMRLVFVISADCVSCFLLVIALTYSVNCASGFSGRKHSNADALSRIPCASCKRQQGLHELTEEVEKENTAICEQMK
jgi:hypothetical protein